jgi:hypothetical protein
MLDGFGLGDGRGGVYLANWLLTQSMLLNAPEVYYTCRTLCILYYCLIRNLDINVMALC